ncbi:MAG: hypothetical protein ACNYWU_07070 [Desulfobacterales bacterium]
MIEKIERPVCRAGTGRSDSNNHQSTIINPWPVPCTTFNFSLPFEKVRKAALCEEPLSYIRKEEFLPYAEAISYPRP